MSALRSIRRAVLPSRTLARYVARMFLARFVLFLIGLTVVLQMLDLMGESDKIMGVAGATHAQLLEYVRLRLPQFIGQFTPFATLLGVVATLATLNQNSEVVVMKAAGLSAFHVIAPPTFIAVLIAIAHFAFNETIVVKAAAQLDYWRDHDYAIGLPEAPEFTTRTWLMDGNTVVEVDTIQQSGRVMTLDNVSLYERDQNANLLSITKARFAFYANGAWTLHDINRFMPADFTISHTDSEPWHTTIPADSFVALAVDPAKASFATLRKSIRDLDREGYPTALMKSDLYHKISAPMSSILMPLLGAVAAFGLARGGALFVRIVAGMALGFTYFVSDNLMIALGEFGATPALLSSWASFLLFALVGLSVLFYTEE